MRKHRALLGIVLIPLALFAAFYAFEQSQRQKLESFIFEIDAAIAKELPSGSTVEQVAAFLDERDIPHGAVGHYNGKSLSYSGDHPRELEETIRYEIRGNLDNYYNILIARFTPYIDFFFDDEKNLVWSRVSISGDGIPVPW